MERNQGFVRLICPLQIAFIVLKLCGVIEWSWFWVLLPVFLSAAAAVMPFVVFWIISRIR